MARSVIFLLEEREDRGNLYFAIVAGIIFHIFLILVKFPKPDFVLPSLEEKKPNVVVLKPPVFKPPEKKIETLRVKKRIIFIPDPGPENAEPIREHLILDEDLNIDNDFMYFPEKIPAPPEDEKVLIVDGMEIMPPVRLTEISPVYPEAARKAGIEGIVILQLLIDKEGNVVEVKVLKGLPFGLTEAAIEEAKKQKFKPAYRSSTGFPVNCIYTLTIRFKLN